MKSVALLAVALLAGSISAAESDYYGDALGNTGHNETYDYVIVGGGNAGLVAALRLSADGNYTVAVVEAGGFYQDDAGNITEIPAYESQFLSAPPSIDWKITTSPQAQLGNRAVLYSQGKTLGGSTARNGMAYQRATVSFHDQWARIVGDDSYNWENMVRFLRRSISYTPANIELRGGPPVESDPEAFEPSGGPLHLTFWNYYAPVSAAFAKGMRALGFKETGLIQSGSLLGFAQFPATIDPDTQIRDSSETSFLRTAVKLDEDRRRVKIYPRTLAKRVIFNESKSATGVLVNGDGTDYVLSASKEVVLAAGVFRTPQLLLVSGVGPAKTLETFEIPVISNISGVGQNMRDHPGFGTLFTVNGVSQHRLWNNATYSAEAETEFENSHSGPLTAFASNYLLFEKFPTSANFSTSTRETISKLPEDWPHVEYIWNTAGLPTNASGDQLSLGVVVLAPTSLGSVTLNSSDTSDNPVVDVGWFTTESDRQLGIEGLKRARVLANATGVVLSEQLPGSSVQTDAEIWEWMKSVASPSHHAVGTCRMGSRDDPSAVVDPKGCVLGGVSSLRIIDSSIMPLLLPGQPMATVSPGAASDEDVEIAGTWASYFIGPRNLAHHSKWPMFMRMYGSVTPLMILPIIFVASWATAITLISKNVYHLGVNHVLLTVLGFVVGLSLSFRSSTAYERYNEGRKYWAQLEHTINCLARLVWVHAEERADHEKDDLVGKVTFCNMLLAFSVALKHRLRFEPFTHYEDLHPRIKNLNVLAHKAPVRDFPEPSAGRVVCWVLGLPMAESNPRKLIKKTCEPLGNIPLEILSHCSAYIKKSIDNGTLKVTIYQTQAMTFLMQMNDVLVGTERVLSTPLPIAYSIAVSQITWVYILLLPFQLINLLGWVTIPATVFAAYIILGIALIGREIENPFDDGVNDLPLDHYCEQIRRDLDIITSSPAPKPEDFIKRGDNVVLWPADEDGYFELQARSIESIREGLRLRVAMSPARN
ncbi:UPF0187 domain membrane protein [Colletotrichum karsti]|uniref:UPF0187 domain membrane protein n=1 Tax=Colletotrichum karsti TaxID=1095194 RepID=A0A9P6HV30_9PEZI|nr:UPF0187 domain membrane protein [Colletotrichum karsti]KAF9870427.1 UPF0187 domain membrane protein [Colletotrichum karsti]